MAFIDDDVSRKIKSRCKGVLDHVHEAPSAMLIPMIVLAVSHFAGNMLMDGVFKSSELWKMLFLEDLKHHLPVLIHYLPLIVALEVS